MSDVRIGHESGPLFCRIRMRTLTSKVRRAPYQFAASISSLLRQRTISSLLREHTREIPTMAFLKKIVDPLGLTTDDDMRTTFITSGTSAIGYRVAINLIEAGYAKHVRVGIWKGKRQVGVDKSVGNTVAKELEAKGATVIAFDISDEDQYKMALSGVNSVFCSLPHIQMGIDQFQKFVKACHHAKVDHFVKASFLRTDGDAYQQRVPYVRFQRACDEVLENPSLTDSRMTYTILAASHLMSTPIIYQVYDKKFVTASYAMGVDYISPNDVAQVGVVALMNRKKHRNKVYNLSGYMYTDEDMASWLSDLYGEKIEHVPIGFHQMEKDLKKRGMSDSLVTDLAKMEQVKATGEDEKASNYFKDLQDVTGHKAEKFKEYLDNKDAMTIQENPAK